MVESLPAAASALSPEEISSLLAANAPDALTQRARLASLKGKHMLFVAGDFVYPACAPFLCEHLRTLRSHGLRITAVFQTGKEDGAYYKSCRPAVDAELFADVGATDGARRIVECVRADPALKFDGVWSPHEAVVTIVSRVARQLGLPGNPPEAYETARDKFKTREKLRERGIRSIRAVQVWSEDDAEAAAGAIGFPMIVKPTSGMGSAGVYRVDNESELRPTLHRVFDDIGNSWGLRQESSDNDGDVSQQREQQAPVIAETCVVPTIFGGRMNEHDVEVLLWRGQLVYGNVIDNLEALPYTYQELGSLAPSLAPPAIQADLIAYAAEAARALGFHTGGFHVEVWHTPAGPILIEVNARVGGGATVDTHAHVWGVNPMLEFALSAMDVPINPPRAATPLCSYGYILPNAHRTGVIAPEADFLERARESPLFKSLAYFKKAGDSVKGLESRLPDWIGEVHLMHEGAPEAVLEEMDVLLDAIHARSAMQTLEDVRVSVQEQDAEPKSSKAEEAAAASEGPEEEIRPQDD